MFKVFVKFKEILSLAHENFEVQNKVLEFPIIIINFFIIIIGYGCLLSHAFLPGTSLEPPVIPTAQVSSFTLQYFPYYV